MVAKAKFKLMAPITSCPACKSGNMQVFLHWEGVPVHQNLLMPTQAAAQQCDRGDLSLGFCRACGFIANLAFEPNRLKYSPLYENSQSCSPLFRAYFENLAADLVRQHNLYHKTIIEIGCGKGDFLRLLCQLGHNRGVGFDPSYVEEGNAATEEVVFIRDFYSERYADYQGDLICSRHTIEHIQNPAELLTSLRRSIGDRPDTIVFFETPDVSWILRNLTFWDIFYEHCSYFCPTSLARLFEACGFQVASVVKSFGNQYLWLKAFPQGRQVGKADTNSQDIADAVVYFATHYQNRMETLRGQLSNKARRGSRKRCVLWGAGAKGVTILNTLHVPLECIEFVVDINPRKQGMYVPGTGQQIVSPEFLKTYQPDTIFLMNPNYFDEVRGTMADLNISAELISL
jgi:SAM-dependent methyltransferase